VGALAGVRALRGRLFGEWLREATLPSGGTALLAARWLYHLAGLRHRTVQLFLDPVHQPDCTLVQVRGMGKLEYPGCFDTAAAGHVIELDGVEDSVYKELSEDLGLTREDVRGLEMLAEYEHRETLHDGAIRDMEFRSVFHGRLAGGALECIRFVDGEVAGICVFSVAALAALVDCFPDRVASGLQASLATLGMEDG